MKRQTAKQTEDGRIKQKATVCTSWLTFYEALLINGTSFSLYRQSKRKMKPVVWVLAVLFVISDAWHSCGDSNGSICPDGNACCNASVGAVAAGDTGGGGSASCISGKEESMGSCCFDGTKDTQGKTGCGDGFVCASDETKGLFYCKKIDPDDDTKPDRVPRYKLCSVPDLVLKEVHGISVTKDVKDPQLAYLSTMGAIDSKDPDMLNRHAKVHTLLVVVHGSSRNVDDYICCTNSALPIEEQDPATSSIMVVAPWFLAPYDLPVNITGDSGATPLVWSDVAWGGSDLGPVYHTWRWGADATNADISSYATVDAIVNRILEDPVRFPSLENIVVTGHSAGGQFTQRWALLSNSQAFVNPSQGYVPRALTRVVVANPKSLSWLDARRYVNGTFRVPDADAINACPWYNEWEWGLGEGNALYAPYKDNAVEVAGGTDAVVQRYQTRDVVYLAGEMDVLPNGQCMATMQGPFRRARSEYFFASLKEIYGYPVHHRLVVSDVNHDHCLMFQSPEGQQALFGTPGET